jgi:serine/threonine-protein kinase
MHLEVGQVLSGMLRLDKMVARGGMGTVWIARHLVLDTDVAVKVMATPWSSVPSARSRFVREARMTARIDSPHVVRVLDCRFTEADEPYLVLELLRGEDLDHRVRTRGPLALGDLVPLVAQACDALAACHDAGFVHRDMKPENVFLVAGGVKLLDFGVAKPIRAEECLDVDKLACGTPQFMSPEHLFEPETTDIRSDLFSLGAVAYFALTGRSPFESDTLEGLCLRMDAGAFVPASAKRADLPPTVDAWFDRALANRREERFADAREMAAALREAAYGGRSGAHAAHAGLPMLPLLRLARLRKASVVALAGVAAALVLLFHGGDGLSSDAIASPEPETPDATAPSAPSASADPLVDRSPDPTCRDRAP